MKDYIAWINLFQWLCSYNFVTTKLSIVMSFARHLSCCLTQVHRPCMLFWPLWHDLFKLYLCRPSRITGLPYRDCKNTGSEMQTNIVQISFASIVEIKMIFKELFLVLKGLYDCINGYIKCNKVGKRIYSNTKTFNR